jgi:hypothetical protein
LEKVEVVMDGVMYEASFVNFPRTDFYVLWLDVLIPCLTIGLITFLPNLMLSNAGTKQAITSATMGLLDRFLLALAGVIGAILYTWKSYPLAVLLLLITFIKMI